MPQRGVRCFRDRHFSDVAGLTDDVNSWGKRTHSRHRRNELMTHRKLLQSKTIAIENVLRGTLRNFGLKVGIVGKVKFEARIQELVETFPDLAALVEPLLIVRRALREQIVSPPLRPS